MSEEIKPNPAETSTQTAHLAAENIASGEEKAPTVDFDADYQAAQEFSVSDVDRTGEGAAMAEEATASQYQMPKAEETHTEAQATGNPDDYRQMAKDVAGAKNQGGSNVTDDLVQKALEKGQPGQ